MYGISVPVTTENVVRYGKEKTLRELKRFDAKRVFLAVGSYAADKEKRAEDMKNLHDLSAYFRENGLETAAWIWAFTCDCRKMSFTPMRGIDGSNIEGFACPKDPSFLDFAAGYMADIAKTGVDMILFDDDLRYGFLGSAPACLCDRHLARVNEIAGTGLSREEVQKMIVSGGPNPVRDAYLRANGEALAEFAGRMRAAVDTVDPEIRFGFCSCLTSWDIDGIDPASLTRILAGKTKPFLRLIGAPYWAVKQSFGGMRLNEVIELERMESAWTRAADIETVSEGDAYPRPRINCPASFAEGFDTALRAAGCSDGILKYGIDYNSDPDYERGYADYHEHNRSLYSEIDEIFGGKTSCGIRIWEFPRKVSLTDVPNGVWKDVNIQDLFYSPAAKLLSHHAIPTVYEGEGVCGICFGENARQLSAEAADSGLILDTAAAEILRGRGIDTGIGNIGGSRGVSFEIFAKDGNRIAFPYVNVYDLKLQKGAEILSSDPESGFPISYRYENERGQRFLVLNFDTRLFYQNDGIFRHCARGKQIGENIPWLCGKKLPAVCTGHPSLYLQSKEKDGTLAVGLWNFFEDPVFDPTVRLEKTYRKVRFIGCDGTLSGDTVVLTDLPAYGFAGFEVE